MNPLLPPSRPKDTHAELWAYCLPYLTEEEKKFGCFLTVCAKYARTIQGPQGDKNELGTHFDDMAAWVTPTYAIAINANTDALTSKHKLGKPTRCTGIVRAHIIGWHKDKYMNWALRQTYDRVPFRRETTGDKIHWEFAGLNFHVASENGTWSEGCSTAPPSQFWDLMNPLMADAKKLYGDRWREKAVPWLHLVAEGNVYKDIDGNPQPPKK